jgi:methyl-accepting chemotaxis protein
MAEQSAGIGQIAQATEDMRRQGDQTSRGLAEQARAAADVSAATSNVARQIAMIVRANREQSENASAMNATLADLRRVGERATQEVRDSGLAAALAERARATAPQAATPTGSAGRR